MRKLLWVGDAGVATGFARATHYTLDVLRRSWDITVLGINYLGDPHPYPYPIYPAYTGGDLFGTGRLVRLVRALDIECVIFQTDVWNIPAYTQTLLDAGIRIPMIGSLALDGKNCQGRDLQNLTLAIFWTKFAETEARLGGYEGPSVVVPLGVDLDIYQPIDQATARQSLEALPDAKAHITPTSFLVGNVNRNQHRKRLDLTVQYFCEWVRMGKGISDAFLVLHTAPTGEQEYDVEQLMGYYGLRSRLILIRPNIGQGIPEAELAALYSCFDVQITTTQGEGFGLTTFEGMACGVPQIVPGWSALGDLCAKAAFVVPCTSVAATLGRVNVLGGIPDRNKFIQALATLYQSPEIRREWRKRGLALVSLPQYRWENVGVAFEKAVGQAVAEPVGA